MGKLCSALGALRCAYVFACESVHECTHLHVGVCARVCKAVLQGEIGCKSL